MPECSMLQNWELRGSSHCRRGEVPGRCSKPQTGIIMDYISIDLLVASYSCIVSHSLSKRFAGRILLCRCPRYVHMNLQED